MPRGTTIASAYIQILPSMDGIKGQLTRVMGGEAKSAGESTGASLGKSLVSTVVKVVAAAGIGKAISSALTAGADLQQSIGGIETLFKDSAAQMREYADQAYKTAGVSANSYMEQATSFAASLISGLGGDTAAAAEYANRAITDMSDNANKMGTDMESIQNAYQGFAKQNYTMLDNLKLGYGGTQAEMQRLIADAAKMTDVQKELGITVDGTSMSFDNIVNAISVIQSDMGIMGTTSLEAAETFSGSLSSMKAAAENLLGNLALGEDIGPSLQALGDTIFTFFNRNLIPMLGNILQNVPEVLKSALSMGIQQLNFADENADVIVTQGIALVSELATGIISAIPLLAEASVNLMAAFGREIFEAGKEIIPSMREGVSVNLPGMLDSGVELATELCNGILQEIPGLLTIAGDMVTGLYDFIVDEAPTILDAGADLLLNLAAGIIDNLPQIVTAAAKVIAKLVVAIGQRLPEIIQAGYTIIGKLASGIIKAIPDLLAQLPQIVKGVADAFGHQDWLSIGTNILIAIRDGFLGAASSVLSAVAATCGEILGWIGTIPGSIGDILSSALEKATTFGSNLIQNAISTGSGFLTNLLGYVKQLPGKIWTQFSNAISRAITFLTNMRSKAIETGSGFLNNLMNYLKQLPSQIWTQFSNAISRAATFLTNMKSKAIETGSGFLNNLINYVKQLPGQIWTQLSGAISKVTIFVSNMKSKAVEAGQGFVSNIKSALSALPGAMWDIGSNIVSGIWNGISSGWSWLTNKVRSLASSLLSAVKNKLGIDSPSKAFRDEVGRWIPEGIAIGIGQNTPSVLKALRTLTQDALTAAAWDDVSTGLTVSGRMMPAYADGYAGGYNQTIHIYSPRELSPYEVARQTKNATRNMVLAMRRS